MSLQEQISEMQQGILPNIPVETLAVMQKATEKLVASNIADTSLKVGNRMPDFALPNTRGDRVHIKDLLDKGPVVLSFYRGGWCPHCNLELRALQQALSEIETEGGQLVAISPETPDRALATSESHDLGFEVLSDAGNKVARMFGLEFTLPEELRPIYAGFGFDIPSYNGDETFELPMPATYVVGSDGIIRYAFVNADYTKRAEPDEVIRALIRGIESK